MSISEMLKRPSAFVPIAMSLLALTIVVVHVLVYGGAREADEGTAAHLWQMLMAFQFPLIAFFAVKWLPRQRRAAVGVLALQLLTGLAAAAPVFLLGL